MSNKPAKQLGLWNIVGLGVGGAIGSGIFVTLGNAIGMTGRSILPITVICVFYMLLAYWYNLAMSGVFVVEGGDYSMKGMLLPPLLTGYGGWTNVIWAFGFTGYALSLTDYLSSLWPVLADHSKLSSVQSYLDGRLDQFEDRMAVLLYRQSVELDMVMSILADCVNLDEEYLRRKRAESVANVKKLNGRLRLEQIAKRAQEQRDGDDGWQD